MESKRSERTTEIESKIDRLRLLMEDCNIDGILLRQQKNFSWITAGAVNPVIVNHDPGFASVLVTRNGRYVVTQNVEGPRLEAEELEGLGFEMVTQSWWEEDLPGAVAGLTSGAAAADYPTEGFALVDEAVGALRPDLTPGERDRYRALGAEVGRAMTDTARAITPGMTEHEITGAMGGALVARGIRPVLYLVAVDERISLYRHAVPTDRKLKRFAVMSVCAERHGLIAAATRLVSFGPVPEETAKKYEALCGVNTAFVSGCRPGEDILQAFEAGCRAYDEAGFPGEWKKHYQGGLIGYAEREVLGAPGVTFPIRAGQAQAWNPTITGTKMEDTFLIGAEGFENITLDEEWPTREVAANGTTLRLPEILIR